MKFIIGFPNLPRRKTNYRKQLNDASAVTFSSVEEVLGVFPW